MGHSLARSVFGFSVARSLWVLASPGFRPRSGVGMVSKRSAPSRRGFSTQGQYRRIVAPLVVPWITVAYGWQWAFIATGALGFIWVVAWLAMAASPQHHPRLSSAELAYIQSDPPAPQTQIRWRALFPHRQTWAFAVGKFLTDPIWWVYLYWVPDFLHKSHGLSLTEIGPPVITIYLLADIGSVGGGWLSSFLIKRNWTVNASRKLAMLVCAVSVVPIVFAATATSLWTAVALIGLAAAAHQGWSANLFTLVSDMFRAGPSDPSWVSAIAGAIGGMLIAKIVGYILQWTGSYFPNLRNRRVRISNRPPAIHCIVRAWNRRNVSEE